MSGIRERVAVDPTLREQARALYIAGQTPVNIGSSLSLKPTTISRWALRFDWRKDRAVVTQAAKKVVELTVQSQLQEQGSRIRERIASSIEAQALMLSDSPPTCLDDLRNTPDRQGLAAVTKTVVEAASAVFGWNAERANGILILDAGRRFDGAPIVCDTVPEQDNKTVDIEAAPTTSPPDP